MEGQKVAYEKPHTAKKRWRFGEVKRVGYFAYTASLHCQSIHGICASATWVGANNLWCRSNGDYAGVESDYLPAAALDAPPLPINTDGWLPRLISEEQAFPINSTWSIYLSSRPYYPLNSSITSHSQTLSPALHIMLTEQFVRDAFAPFEAANGQLFMETLSDNVSWTATGKENPLGGHWTTKSDVAKHVFAPLTLKMESPIKSKVSNVLISGDWATVEMTGTALAKSGRKFENELAFLCRFEEGKIVEVRTYIDSALVKAILEE
jgi:ketosteroid isomerase-like protein